jgi:hypothetical protein
MGHLGALQITPFKNVDCSINSGWIGAMLVWWSFVVHQISLQVEISLHKVDARSGNGDHKNVSLKTIDCCHRPNFMQVSRGYQKSSLTEDVMLKTLKSIGFTLDLLESVQIKNHLYLSNFDTCLSNNQLVLKFSFWQIEYSWNFNTSPSFLHKILFFDMAFFFFFLNYIILFYFLKGECSTFLKII